MIDAGRAFFHWTQVVNASMKAIVGTAVGPFYSFTGDPRPRITYHRIGARRLRHLRGKTGTGGQQRVLLQVNLYARTVAELRLMQEQMEAIDNAKGTWDGQKVKNVQISEDRDDDENMDVGNPQKKPEASFDLQMWMEG